MVSSRKTQIIVAGGALVLLILVCSGLVFLVEYPSYRRAVEVDRRARAIEGGTGDTGPAVPEPAPRDRRR